MYMHMYLAFLALITELQDSIKNLKYTFKQGFSPNYYIVWLVTFNVRNMDLQAVMQHASRKIHIFRTSDAEKKGAASSISDFFVKDTNTAKTVSDENAQGRAPTPSSTLCSNQDIQPLLIIIADQVTKAEALWAMKTADANLSFSMSNDLPLLFQEMFPDSIIAKKMQLYATKVSYSV